MFLIPSFYVFMSFFAVLIFMSFSSEYSLPLSAWMVIYLVLLVNFVATFVFYKPYSYVSKIEVDVNTSVLFVLLFLGFIGLCQYIFILEVYFGGIVNFLYVLMSSPHEIRWANSELANAPLLVYFGWIGFFLYFFSSTQSDYKKKLNWLIILLVIVNFTGNLLFIDRTRPFWLLFFILSTYIYKNSNNDKRLYLKIISSLLVLLLVFILIGIFIGKIQPEQAFDKVKGYFIGGVLYLSHLIEHEIVDYKSSRLIYPLAKVIVYFGGDLDVPSQILPFYKVPFITNVGTYLEPAYSSAGLIGMILFILFHSFVLNYICLYSIKSCYLFPKLFWSCVCFSGLLAFFVPKINTTFVSLVFVIMILEILLKILTIRKVK